MLSYDYLLPIPILCSLSFSKLELVMVLHWLPVSSLFSWWPWTMTILHWFWFTIFLGRSSSAGFHLGFSHHNSLHSTGNQCRGSPSCCIYLFQLCIEIITRWVYILWDRSWAKTHLPLDFHKPWFWLGRETQWHFGSSEISFSSGPVSNSPPKVWLFPFL